MEVTMKYAISAVVAGLIILILVLPIEPVYAGSKKGKDRHGAKSGITPKDSADLKTLIEELQKERGGKDTSREGDEDRQEHGIIRHDPSPKIDFFRVYGPRALRRG